MSFGFAVHNDLGRRVIDETHALHTVVPAMAERRHKVFSEPAGAGYNFFEQIGALYTFDRPYRGSEPPMVFMRGDGSHPSEYSSRWYREFGVMWYNELRYELIGTPGAWTGAFVAAVVWRGQSYSSTLPSPIYDGWDLRDMFMVAGTSASRGADGYGIVVYDAIGNIVFNSNDNFVEVLSYSATWDYQSHDGYGGEWIELWHNPGVVVPSNQGEWVSLVPFSFNRRHNGETVQVFPSNLTRGYTPHVCVIGSSSSSSPFHLPMMTVKTKLPVEYRYV